MSLADIVNINITRESRAVSRAGFGTALFLSSVPTFAEAVRVYSNLKAVAADFLTSTDVYKAALAHFGQELKPKSFIVGKRRAKVSQVVTVTPTVVNSFSYVLTIDGVEYQFLSDASALDTEIVSGLAALVNADANALRFE